MATVIKQSHRRLMASVRGVGLACVVGISPAMAQSPTLPDALPSRSRPSTSLGPTPGAGGGSSGLGGGDDEILGGRPGTSTPRVPTSISRPSGAFARPEPKGLAAPLTERDNAVPLFGALAGPVGDGRDEASGGMTLDMAIERLVHANLDLKGRRFEIPQARADVLTAGLRGNPILYADGQIVPYGSFSRARPGGPTQYDVNISQPFDLTGKRKARTVVATRAVKVLEAQYQDSVRVEIDAMASAFVDVLAANESVRQLQISVKGLGEVLETTKRLQARGLSGGDEVDRFTIQVRSAELGLDDAEETVKRSLRALGLTLNLGPGEVASLRVQGSIRDTAPPPGDDLKLIQLALGYRPDLCAYRLGVGRAEADVALAKAERLSDVYVLYQPYTFQNNAPFQTKSAHSWALGVSVPLPVYNRNQGNILRPKINVVQSKTEFEALEKRVATEVEQAAREYAVTRSAVERIERDILPVAGRVRDGAEQLFRRGGSETVAYLNARREYNEVVREYRDLLVRHRRSMLALNTAVGVRVLP